MIVLVVDHRDYMRGFFSRVLAIQGHSALMAQGWTEARPQLETQVPDLIITTWDLPGEVKGHNVVQSARAFHPQLPAIIASADGRAAEAATKAHAVFLEKPFLPEDLFAAIDQAMMTAPPPTPTTAE